MTDNRKERAAAMVRAKELVRSIYGRYDGGAGCCWHVVLDDGNTERGSIEWCAEYVLRQGHPDCVALAELSSTLSTTQFGKLARTKGRA